MDSLCPSLPSTGGYVSLLLLIHLPGPLSGVLCWLVLPSD
jgi:hypothetical protein